MSLLSNASSVFPLLLPSNNLLQCSPVYGTSLTIDSCNTALAGISHLHSPASLSNSSSLNFDSDTIPTLPPHFPFVSHAAGCMITICPAGPFDIGHLSPSSFHFHWDLAYRTAQAVIESCVEHANGKGGWMTPSMVELGRFVESTGRINLSGPYPTEAAFFTVAVTHDHRGGPGPAAPSTGSPAYRAREEMKRLGEPGNYDWQVAQELVDILINAMGSTTRGTPYFHNLSMRMRRFVDVVRMMRRRNEGWRWWDNPYRPRVPNRDKVGSPRRTESNL